VNVTQIELEFVELPDIPNVGAPDLNNGYLLSMWDCSCKLATWNPSLVQFEDAGGPLNGLAIRSWAVLPKPLDFPTWGAPIIEAAIANDASYAKAGWLESKYTASAKN